MTTGAAFLVLVLALVALFFIVQIPFWLVRRANTRPCPVCGSRVKVGQLDCEACGHDFAAHA